MKIGHHNYFLHLFFVFALIVSFFSGCSTESPEEQIHTYIAKAKKYAEKRDAGDLKKLISRQYSDEKGLTRSELVRIAAGYFFRNQTIFIQEKIGSIELIDENTSAHVNVAIAVSSNPIDKEDMRLLNAEFHIFNLKLIYQDEWLLQTLEWQPISLDEYLNIE